MKAQLIRSACVKFTIKDQKFLIDPWLCEKEGYPPFLDPLTISRGQNKRQPLVELPFPLEKLLDGLNFNILTHLHPDHFDYTMNEKLEPIDYTGKLNKDLPIFVQNEEEVKILTKWGFKDVKVFKEEPQTYNGIEITKIIGKHGTKMLCGPASGVILKAEGKKIYVAGDNTIYFEGVEEAIKKFSPDYIFVNAASAEMDMFGRLLMNAEDVIKTAKIAPKQKSFVFIWIV